MMGAFNAEASVDYVMDNLSVLSIEKSRFGHAMFRARATDIKKAFNKGFEEDFLEPNRFSLVMSQASGKGDQVNFYLTGKSKSDNVKAFQAEALSRVEGN